MNMIREEYYAKDMDTIVIPYLKERKLSGNFERAAGQRIHYRCYAADEPRAQLVLMHGFTEGIDKFNEVVYYFLQEGFQVWQIQQRGHGDSFREVSDPSLVHISSYLDLVEDLHYFVSEIVKKAGNQDLPLYLYGHSMGGGVSAVYLETWPDDFRKAVLSSPMLELNSGPIPLWAASLYAKVMILLGKGANYMPGNQPFRAEPDFENSCSNCRPRYDYWFHQTVEQTKYQTCASSIQTARQFLKLTKYATSPKNCAKVQADVLLVQAGKDTMVNPGGQETFLRQIGSHGRLFRMDHAKHEIYLGTDADLQVYWKEVLGFLKG